MFGILKKKLKEVLDKVSGKTEKKEYVDILEKKEDIEKVEEIKEEMISEELKDESIKEDEENKNIEESIDGKIIEEIEEKERRLDEKEEHLRKKESVEELIDKLDDNKEEEIKESADEEAFKAIAEQEDSRIVKEIEEEKKELEEIKEKIIEEIKQKEIPADVEESAVKEKKRFSIFKKIREKTLSEDDVRDILSDIKHALLENDVALEVTEKIYNDVKNDLVGKDVPRTRAKDIVELALKDAVYDVLNQEKVDIEQMIKDRKDPLLVIFLGFNGVGKCVSGDTIIPLSNGNMMTIADIYNKAKGNGVEVPTDDGFYIKNPNIKVFSTNPYTLKIENIDTSRIWKMKKEKLIKVNLENGHEVSVTPEHPFFILGSGKIIQKRADEVALNDYVMVPKNVEHEARAFSRVEILRKIMDRKLFIKSENIVKYVYSIMEREYGSLKEAHNKLISESDWNTFRYCWKNENRLPSTIILKIAEKDTELLGMLENERFHISFGRSAPMKLPEPSSQFFQWLGLFYSEGHMDKKTIDFTNSEDWLLDTFSDLTKSVFGICNINTTIDRRNLNVKRKVIANGTLVHYMKKAVEIPKYKKSSCMALPNWILRSSNGHIANFLRAYFEGDGHVHLNRRAIEASTASEKFARQLSIILLRFGIISSISTKNIKGKSYYRLYIVGKSKIHNFCEKIGFLGDRKQKTLEKLLVMPAQFEKTELIPMQSEYIRNLRESVEILQQDLAETLDIGPSLLCQYERGSYQVKIPTDMIAKLAVKLSSSFLSQLANADVRWIRVRNIEEVIDSDEWVYDFTVPGYHNFVANNFIVHNTTNLAKLAHRLKKYKPVLAAGDTFRAASIEQLEEHGKRLGVDVVKHRYGADSAAVIFDAMRHASAKGSKLVLADTAGRSHINTNLMDELKKVCRVNKPDLKVLVLDALTGNDIYEQARLFNESVGVDAIILTKTDVYEKGGAALSAAYTIKKPILFLGSGQNYDDLVEFDAEKIVKNLLG